MCAFRQTEQKNARGHCYETDIARCLDTGCNSPDTNHGGIAVIMEPFCKSRRAKSPDDATTWKHAEVANTLNTFDQGEARANEIIVMATQQGGAEICKDLCPTITAAAGMSGNNQPVTVYAIDQQGGKGGANYAENVMPTLCSDSHGTPHGVAYGFDPGASRDVGALFIEECGKTLTNGTCPGHHDGVVISRPIHSMTTGDYMQVNEEKTATLLARDYKDPTCVEFYDEKTRNYIVRRLTPTECARLQGFPDKWGHVESKSNLTDEEYEFWKEVYLTKQIIDGKVTCDENGRLSYTSNSKPYEHKNKAQLLTWYNKLWTDSAEYKMWGNGIALPCALYVLQGIKDALVNEQVARSKWLDDLLNN